MKDLMRKGGSEKEVVASCMGVILCSHGRSFRVLHEKEFGQEHHNIASFKEGFLEIKEFYGSKGVWVSFLLTHLFQRSFGGFLFF